MSTAMFFVICNYRCDVSTTVLIRTQHLSTHSISYICQCNNAVPKSADIISHLMTIIYFDVTLLIQIFNWKKIKQNIPFRLWAHPVWVMSLQEEEMEKEKVKKNKING
jgi:hypothetical protein